MQSISGNNIKTQNLLIDLLTYSFKFKEQSQSIYQNRFLKEVLQTDNTGQLKGDFKKNVGFGKFSLINQNPAFEFNVTSEFLNDNPIIAQALKEKQIRNYSNQDSFLFFLKDINSLEDNGEK